MNYISSLIIPIMVLGVIIYGVYKKINVYDTFIEGSKESFEMVLTIFPNLLGMILAINLLLNCNFLNLFGVILKPILDLVEVPFTIIPMVLMRPISGSSTLAMLNNILSSYGPDSFIGTLASVIQGSTDTTFYVITLYFGSVGIKKIRYSLYGGLFADLVGILASIIIVKIIF
ncbi:MAG TPA: spore maturation protein [Bacilli bacterium]|nr:spore maturation protein [Bacilli bacterium]